MPLDECRHSERFNFGVRFSVQRGRCLEPRSTSPGLSAPDRIRLQAGQLVEVEGTTARNRTCRDTATSDTLELMYLLFGMRIWTAGAAECHRLFVTDITNTCEEGHR